MEKLFDVAYTICNISGYNLTHMQLQKIIYIIQMLYIGNNDKTPLFNGHFEAWKYGPVEIALYEELSGFGRTLIPRWSFMTSNLIHKDSKIFETIKDIVDTLSMKTVGFLVSYTHNEFSAWKRIYKEGEKIEISNEDIFDEYSRRFKK